MNDHIVMETGEQVPAPDRYERFGNHYAALWEFGPGEIFPQTGEIVLAGDTATIMCCGDVRPVRQLTRRERRKAARLYAEAGL